MYIHVILDIVGNKNLSMSLLASFSVSTFVPAIIEDSINIYIHNAQLDTYVH